MLYLGIVHVFCRNVVEQLLKLQASANIPDQKGCVPLHLAVWRGNVDICRVLLTHGPSIAKVNAQVFIHKEFKVSDEFVLCHLSGTVVICGLFV